MTNLAGTTLKGYDLHERIGAGGFGAVYRAFQSSVGREVAIKIILPDHANKPEFIRRFETEAQLVARLEHLHIVPLHDYWRGPEGAYLVMRYLRGGSLEDLLAQGALDLETIARLLDQVSSALTIAHRNQVIHRDIKPANILLDEDGNAYLADFGIAKDMAVPDGKLTDPDALIGSPDYLAPEQARIEQVTPQTDIYSLGVVLYELLVGEHPFPGRSAIERLYAHLNDPIPEIVNLDEDIAKDINEVIQKATAKDPLNRFADVMALAAAFRDAAALNVSRTEPGLIELLTPREQEVLKLIVEGKSNREIAKKLTVEISTIKWYINQIYTKLNVRSRVQAIVKARELNLIVDGFKGDTSTSIISQLPLLENPYKGLQAFTAADEKDFFGRERLIEKLLKRLGDKNGFSRFLAVVGPSGSGKSSLVRAGLIPALWRGQLENSDKWYVVEMIPGSHPLDELEVALTRVAGEQAADLHEHLHRDERGLLRASKIILPDDGSELLIVIDQFEEVFTLVDDEEQRAHFLDLLYAAATDKRSRVRIVITMRADFYDRPLHYPQFGEMMRERMETVLPLGAQGLERAITQPATQVGVKFEDGLVASIVSEINYQPGALPLLQYALTELFEAHENRILTHEAYEGIGRAVGALARRAEEIFNEFGAEGQEAARQMFLRLVTLGEGVEDTRRRVARHELIAIADDPDLMDEVIDTYADYRLLSLDNDPATRTPTVEVAHEAILREWERLREWLNESRDDIRLQRQLAGAAENWENNSEEESFLLRGTRLSRYLKWQEEANISLTKLENFFLQASEIQRDLEQAAEAEQKAREERLEKRGQRNLQWMVAVFAIATIVSIILTNFAFGQQVIAEEQTGIAEEQAGIAEENAALAETAAENAATQQAVAEEQARLAISRELSQSATLNLDKDPELSILLALQALDLTHTFEAEGALHQAVQSSRVRQTLIGHNDVIWDIEYSPDGSRLASRDEEDIIKIWDVATGEMLVQIQTPDNYEEMIAFSPDGSRLAGGNETGEVTIWDTSDGSELLTLQADLTTTWMIDFSPDGAYLVTAGLYDARLVVWDTVTGEEIVQLEQTTAEDDADHIYTFRMGFTPDGKHLAYIRSSDGDTVVKLIFVETETWQEVATIDNFPLGPIAFHPVDNVVATMNYYPLGYDLGKGVVGFYRYDLSVAESTYDPFITAKVGTDRVFDMNFSPDGSHFLTSTGTEEPTLWKLTPNELELAFILKGHYTLVAAHAFSPDGQYAATGGKDGVIRIWDISQKGTEESLSLLIDEGDQAWRKVLYTPDGSRFITSGGAEAAKVWDAESGGLLMELSGHEGNLRTLTVSPDGTQAATAGDDGIGRLYNLNNGELMVNLIGHEIAPDDGTLPFIYSIRYSPDGSLIATAGVDGTARLWDAASGEELFIWQVMPGNHMVYAAEFSPDGSELAVGARGFNAEDSYIKGVVKIYDLETYEEVHVITGEEISGSIVYGGLVYNPAGTLLAIKAEQPGSVTMWDTASREVKYSLAGITPFAVLHAVFSPDGDFLYVPTPEGVQVINVETGIKVMALPSNGRIIHGMSISPDGTKIVTLDISGLLKLQVLELGVIIEIAQSRVTRDLTEAECQQYLHVDACPPSK